MNERHQFPFKENYLEFDGVRLHYVDEGSGPAVIMVHGQPTWSYIYRKMVPPLVGAGYRCVIPDLMGFGLSDKPVDESAYSLQKHVESISALAKELQLSGVVTVGHDWGGPISLGYATHNRDNVRALVILNTFMGVPPVPTIFRLMFTSKLSSFLVRRMDIMRKLSFRGKFDGKPLFIRPVDSKAMEQYWMPHPTAATRAGIAAFPKMIPTSEEHENSDYIEEIKSTLASWEVPLLTVFSDKDPFFSVKDGQDIASAAPNGRFHLIKDAGHYLQEDAGEEVAERIVTFLKSEAKVT